MHDKVSSPQPLPLRPLGALLLVMVFFAAFMTAISFGTSGDEGFPNEVVLSAAWVVGLLMALFVGLVRHAPSVSVRAAVGLVRPGPRVGAFIVLGVLVGGALGAVGADLMLWLSDTFPRAPLTREERSLVAQLAPSGWFAIGMVEMVHHLGKPVLEESLFRGLMQPKLGESVGPWRAFLFTGALYVAPLAVFPYGVPAGVLLAVSAGLLVWWTRSTWVAISCHVTFVASRELVLRVAEPSLAADAREFYRLPAAALALLFGTAVLGLFLTWKLQSRWQDHEVRS